MICCGSIATGCDAQPYFRTFNLVPQLQKFDPDGKFMRRYVPVPELATAQIALDRTYRLPLVDYNAARRIALARYGELTNK